MKVFLIDALQHSKIKAVNKNYVNVQNVSIKLDNRSAIFQHPDSRIEFPPFLLGKNPKLSFACGIRQNIWGKLNHSIIFEVFVKTLFRKSKRIFSKEISPNELREGGWFNCEINLADFENTKTQIIFSTSVPFGENTNYCWSVWGNPILEYEFSKVKKASFQKKPAHVFFITSDALRYDYLGVYGNTIVKTPHCNQLANDGVVFDHARVQTAGTIGSYASMLLSQSPLKHSVIAEWGAIKKSFQSLPEYLNSYGYDSVLIPSELELIEPKAGLIDLFNKHIPCYGNPSQDGKITTRLAIHQIERQKKPTFFWLQYFDTHPPVTPPKPYSLMYYSNDPTAEENRYRPELVQAIHGVETIQEMYGSLSFLREGIIDEFLVAKLEASALALQGGYFSNPDLAIHIQNIGPSMHKNMPIQQFAKWLEQQVLNLRNGTVPQELLTWIDEIYPILLEIDKDILAWLDGVIDFRYPLAQYASAVSYFDSHVGDLMNYLKENDLYDRSLIVLTSPHGEILDEHGMYFHHHTLVEECVRVPAIIKPSHQTSYQSGTHIDGILDSIDIFPTLIDLLRLPIQKNIEGHSRAINIQQSTPIPDHNSFSLNNSYTMASVTKGSYKFIKANKEHINSQNWHWKKGDKKLFNLRDKPTDTNNLLQNFPEISKEMEQDLDIWLSS